MPKNSIDFLFLFYKKIFDLNYDSIYHSTHEYHTIEYNLCDSDKEKEEFYKQELKKNEKKNNLS